MRVSFPGASILRSEVTMLIALAITGVTFFFLRFGWAYFDPTNVEWMLAGEDSAMFYLGWSIFRLEPWSWPLGSFHGYLAPLGASIPMTDSLPLLAIPFKLVSSALPIEFQYFGMWTCFCYAMQAVFGYLLVGHVTRHRSVRVLGALLLLLFPPLLLRFGHIALASHWLLLAALVLYFRVALAPLRTRLIAWTALIWLCSVVHPYLTVMALGIATAAWWRVAIGAHGRERIVSLVMPMLLAGVVLLSFTAAGHFIYAGDAPPGTEGFGHYSMNLNAVINPLGSSQLLQDRQLITSRQVEGMNYAGAGVLALGFFALAMSLARPGTFAVIGRHALLAALCVVFTLLALSTTVTWDDDVILRYQISEGADPLLAAVRASGRLFWPVLYLSMLAAIWVLARELHPRSLITLLAAALALQLYDLHRVFDARGVARETYTQQLSDPRWAASVAQVDTLYVDPPFRFSMLTRADFKHFARLGALQGTAVTTGYTARLPYRASTSYENYLERSLRTGAMNPSGLYVVEFSELIRSYSVVQAQGWRADRWDGYNVLVPPQLEVQTSERFTSAEVVKLEDYVARHTGDTLLLVVRDEATERLSERARDQLRALGFGIDALACRGSYAAVFAEGSLRFEQIRADDAIHATFAAGSDVGGWIPRRSIQLHSSGYLLGNYGSIEVEGEEAWIAERGFNLARLNDQGRMVALGVFDTHADTTGYVMELRATP